jgi:predicted ribonuclease YlaK
MDLVEQSGFTFSLDIIRDFYLNLTSLDDKHFVILSGFSGTGKTQLCRVFANAVGFHKRYKMGAYCFSPGENLEEFKEWIQQLFNLRESS